MTARGACAWAGIDRVSTSWPAGYRVRFNPTELVAPNGTVIAREGDLIDYRFASGATAPSSWCDTPGKGSAVAGGRIRRIPTQQEYQRAIARITIAVAPDDHSIYAPPTDGCTKCWDPFVGYGGAFHAVQTAHGPCAWLGKDPLPVLWPAGYSVRFNPTELIGPDGNVVGREGDSLWADGAGDERETAPSCEPLGHYSVEALVQEVHRGAYPG